MDLSKYMASQMKYELKATFASNLVEYLATKFLLSYLCCYPGDKYSSDSLRERFINTSWHYHLEKLMRLKRQVQERLPTYCNSSSSLLPAPPFTLSTVFYNFWRKL